MKIILYAIPGFILLILLEWLYGLARGRNTYRVADTITSISLGSISRLRNLVFLGFGAWFYTSAADGWHLFDLPDKGFGIWLFALVAYDFSYYWFHRVSHEVNLFWAAHVVHHQSEDYNLGTALRQSGSGLFGFIFYLPWLYIGIPPEILFASGAINLVYQFWVHTEHVPKLGPLEYLFVTASNHRVHHAQNNIYIDRNYGGIFIIWDRMFGSFQEELANEPCIYGIRKPLKSYNPFWANVHVYWSVLLDCWHASRWQDKIKIWFREPGWRPAGLDQTHPVERVSLEDFSKYDPAVSTPVNLRILPVFLYYAGRHRHAGGGNRLAFDARVSLYWIDFLQFLFAERVDAGTGICQMAGMAQARPGIFAIFLSAAEPAHGACSAGLPADQCPVPELVNPESGPDQHQCPKRLSSHKENGRETPCLIFLQCVYLGVNHCNGRHIHDTTRGHGRGQHVSWPARAQ